jgi:hypothetical protein
MNKGEMMDIVTAARQYALSEIKKYGAPSQYHFEISEKKAMELVLKHKADQTIVLLGIYLMDLKLGEALTKGKVSEHVAMSAVAADGFVSTLKLADDVKKKVMNCIEAHHKAVPFTCIEAEICANADCYRFLHPKGFFAYLGILSKRSDDFLAILDDAEKKLDEKHAILSLKECKKELEPYYETYKAYIKAARTF